ncbi:2-vinyl bacteriochlorophyllide hydratase [Ectothiorhodospira haloalkaliphila]|uniref:2-vinyl bacteriochlorophyllide hydratase n=1 Tax=Ectothiorhodospira haloalkaliphila TaxID=421628 RepID=W8L5L6_9GAMM|nr:MULTISPECIES: 2-vinyl bacteriochlorophyllide hydratase [Ectothiorhodospira]TVQ74771.1 MAG: 2-vinyl bacteriochlorophyllide hydratase [Chromatiaceae bacterium]AHK79145.1 2-vinyl bacteriochlorophyllide hydratase [Ectothiorhodospira haloalkaliphila]MCG5495047.1 2-vinyl bacteriochlorophyllide hydratase [Ectothiorhodospira variabilis]MCG5498588.1 2-vinyl bacteriochlorophyllide hydratase [Ectothiorhodospira variabilis]MCG5504634.1 2-vinyl bacteriochlorophyllide hydratase [Ectothiorhodospira variab
MQHAGAGDRKTRPLYTPEERRRRDETPWTLVQGILAPLQFLVFIVSTWLVLRYLMTGEGLWLAHASIVIKTLILYTIMVTGAIWEKVVFGHYLFAKAFFWEDMVSMMVIALHTIYMASLFWSFLTVEQQMYLALVAYAVYVVNAAQFLIKLRAARLGEAEAKRAQAAASGGESSK